MRKYSTSIKRAFLLLSFFLICNTLIFIGYKSIYQSQTQIPPPETSEDSLTPIYKPASSNNKLLYYNNIGGAFVDSTSESNSDINQNIKSYTVEISIEKNQRDADVMLKKLLSHGITDVFYTPLHVKGRSFFRVRKGIYRTKREAKVIASRLKGKTKLNLKIRQL